MTIAPRQMCGHEYHRDLITPEPSLSSTTVKTLITETPLDAWCDNSRLNPNWEAPNDDDFKIGHAAHSLVLGVGAEMVVIPAEMLSSNGAATTKAAKEFVAESKDAGLIPVKQKDFDAVHGYADAVNRALKACGMTIDPTRSEIAAFAHFDGVWNRMQADNAPLDPRLALIDLKTTAGGVHPDELARTVSKLRYDVSAVHYLQTWKAATGEDRRFRLVFVSKPEGEKKKNRMPQVGIVELYNDGSGRISSDYAQDEPFSGDWFADAEMDLQRARKQWRRCLDTGQWPGYPVRPALIGAPVWHRKERAVMQGGDLILPKGDE